MSNIQGAYDKKISGSSKSINTFAAELKTAITKYEDRLEKITVSMTYIREERLIYITVKGVIISTKEDYIYDQVIKVWN
jgi:predicted component of type VI protein secretion system